MEAFKNKETRTLTIPSDRLASIDGKYLVNGELPPIEAEHKQTIVQGSLRYRRYAISQLNARVQFNTGDPKDNERMLAEIAASAMQKHEVLELPSPQITPIA